MEDAIRPWRRATLAASLLAAVELVLLLVAGAALLARPLARAVERRTGATAAARPAARPSPAPVAPRRPAARQPAAAARPRSAIRVLVLNGNGRTGAAHAEAARLSGLGYRIAGAADASRSDYATTLVMYRPGYRAEALRLARDLHVQAVGPLDGIPPARLGGGQLAVILGAAD